MKIQIIETVVVLVLYVLLKVLIHRYIDRIDASIPNKKKRSKIVKKSLNVTMLIIFSLILLSIWGVNQSELAVFIGSVLTVLGIALFAQWSILSNVTSGIIIFFNHSIELEDTITIIDKDYEIDGRVSDIGLFFVVLKNDHNERIDIPNSVFLNKMIKKKNNAHS
jgi:small-conductance mechanosensitive channel